MAKLTAPLLEQDSAPDDPLALQREAAQIRAVADHLQHNPFLEFITEGFELLSAADDEQARSICDQLTQAIEKLSIDQVVDHSPDSELATLLNLKKESLDAIERLAKVYLEEYEMQKAAGLYAIAAFLQNTHPELWFHLGFSLLGAGFFEAASRALEIARQLQPQQPEYAILHCSSLFAQGERQAADEALQCACQAIEDHQLTLSDEWQKSLQDMQKACGS